MEAVGSVIIGSTKSDTHAFTDDVISSSLSSDTGISSDKVDTRQAKVHEGELVTLFWGVVGTTERGCWAID